MAHQIKTIKLVELNFIFKENALFERKSKAKKNNSWPLTLIMQKRDHFRLLRHHYSESPVIPLSNDIWYWCVAHGFITFYFLIFCRWSKSPSCHLVVLLNKFAFGENKLINLGSVVSMPVFLYFFNSLKYFFLFTSADMDFLVSRDTVGHWFCSINDGKHNQN